MPQGRRSIGDAARGGPLRDKKARCPSPSPTRRGCARASRMGKMYASALKKARLSFAQRFDNASPTMSCTQRRRCGDRVLRQPACLSNQSVLSLSLSLRRQNCAMRDMPATTVWPESALGPVLLLQEMALCLATVGFAEQPVANFTSAGRARLGPLSHLHARVCVSIFGPLAHFGLVHK